VEWVAWVLTEDDLKDHELAVLRQNNPEIKRLPDSIHDQLLAVKRHPEEITTKTVVCFQPTAKNTTSEVTLKKYTDIGGKP